MITQEQAQQIKQQLLSNLNNFPEENREQIKQQVNAMSVQEIEQFIKQNQLTHLENQCVICSIIQGKIQSYKIDENENNIAILEINPLTKAHTLIIPKEHLAEIPDSAKQLAKQVSQKISHYLKPVQIKANETKITSHPIIELVPVYENQTPKQRQKASEQDLKNLQKILTQPMPPQPNEAKKPEPVPKLPPRIP